jgi:hypothetical protein
LRRFRVEDLEARLLLATFIVTDTSDSATDTGSLRHAITMSNQTGPGPNTIDFNIGGLAPFNIVPVAVLPLITVPVVINGYSQPGASANTNGPGLGDNAVLKIVLDGEGVNDVGLRVSAGGSTITGLVINGWGSDGIDLTGAGGDTISGNFIGTDFTGENAFGNGGNGISVLSPNNTVGGTTAAARNVISGNKFNSSLSETGIGVFISGLFNGATNANGNVVQGNFIGTTPRGRARSETRMAVSAPTTPRR